MQPKALGEVTEGIVLAELLKMGLIVLLPFGNNQPYDLVIDEGGGRFVRVQVKTGQWANGCVVFPTSSRSAITGKRTSYEGRADVFLVYSQHTDRIYRVPVGGCGISSMQLRVDPARGGSKSTIRWARDYEFGVPRPSA